MRARVAAGLAFWTVLSCGDGAVEPPAPPPAPVATTVTVTPGSATLTALGATARFTAEVRDQNGQVMAGATVAWSSSDASVAAVDASGQVTAVTNGAATITATAGSVSATAAVTVAQVVSAVVVSPAVGTLVTYGDTLRLVAEATDANGHAVEGATEFTWVSSDTLVAKVDNTGLVETVAEGEAVVTATTLGVTGQVALTVVPPLPTTITVSPDTVRFTALGQAEQLAAEVREQSGRVMGEALVSWASADTLVAAVDSTGLLTAMRAGTTTVTAQAGDVSDDVVVSVTQSAGSVVVTPAEATIGPGNTLRLVAEALDENGHTVNGAVFSWSSSDGDVARVDASGLVKGVAEGTATITATAGSASGAAEITVENLDRAALVALYNATDGPNWVNNENWLTDAPLGEWYGVSTDDYTGRVTRIELSGKWDADEGRSVPHGLTGSIPPELGNLASLSGLFLAHNQLTGPIPPELGNLGYLNWLDLRFNQLTGPIPPELGRLTYLTALTLSGNSLSGPIPSELGNLAHLTSLELRINSLSGPIPPELGNLTSLRHLELNGNGLSGPIPPELGSLGSLSSLWLGNNGLTGPIPPELGNLADLSTLWLSGNSLSGTIPPELGKLANLKTVTLSANNLTGPIPPELGNLASVEWLELAINRLTGAIPAELGNLATLEQLELDRNRLTGPIPPELGKLTKLMGLHLFTNNLAGPLPPELGNLTSLRWLGLANNVLLTGALPATLTDLASLQQLRFQNTGLCAPQTTEFQQWLRGVDNVAGKNCDAVLADDRDALAAIHKWTNGREWRNSENWLSDKPLDDWYGVTADGTDRVTDLDLSDNNLSGTLPLELGDLLYLETVALNGNDRLAGELPSRMLHQIYLSRLRLDGTALCVPRASVFRTWLERIAERQVALCPDDHGNQPSNATVVSLGEAVEGELESYADEDWFRVELTATGTLSVATESSAEVGGTLHDREGGLVGYAGYANETVLRRLGPGTYHVRVGGATGETRGQYTLVASFEPRAPGVRAYLTQAVQSHDFNVPLVAGEDALLRVFVIADRGVTASMPPVQVTFYRGGAQSYSLRIEGSSNQVPWTMAENDLGATANAVVPGTVLVPGTEMVVEVDPDGTLDPSLGIGGRIPEEGRMALDIRAVPNFDVTVVPFLSTENPDSSGYKVAVELTADHELFYKTREWLPVANMEVSLRDAVLVDYDPTEDLGRVLNDVELLHTADGASGYYMGAPPWIERGYVGVAFLESKVSVSRLDGHTIAHEFGHNLSLRHAPCGGPLGVDGAYPHSGGRIGAWGYDFRHGNLVDPESFTDLMTYCRANDWISDYSFSRASDYRVYTGAALAGAAAGERRVLVLRGGVAEGRLKIEPAFVLDAKPTLPERGGAYRIVGSDAAGGELFALRFGMREVADTEDDSAAGFTFAIPTETEWANALAAITLEGPEGSVSLSANDSGSPATALVLDAATGRIRAILRESSVHALVAADGAGPIPPGTITLISRGIPDAAAWRRR